MNCIKKRRISFIIIIVKRPFLEKAKKQNNGFLIIRGGYLS